MRLRPLAPDAPEPLLSVFERFAAAHLRIEDGGPLLLDDVQRAELADYFSGVRELVTVHPKKTGKTSLVAGVSIFELIVNPDFVIALAANSRDQALRTHQLASGFIRRSPWLTARLRPTRREIRSNRGHGVIEVMAADVDTADGWIGDRAFVDELHRAESLELFEILKAGIGPRRGSIWTYSTAGDDETSALGKIRRAAQEMPGFTVDGVYKHVSSPGFAFHELSLDPEDDVENFELVAQLHPRKTPEELRAEYESPTMSEWFWARFYCGLWVKGEGAAISPTDWARAKSSEPIPPGSKVILGVDLGWRWDTTAIVPLANVGGKWRFGTPTILVPPRDGTSMSVEKVFDAIVEATRVYEVEQIVLDPAADGEHLAQRIERELDLKVTAHSQKATPMSEAAQRFTALLRAGEIEHPDDPAFTSHVLAAVAKTASDGTWRFVKDRANIDALIAAAIALNVAAGKRPSVYEKRGILTIPLPEPGRRRAGAPAGGGRTWDGERWRGPHMVDGEIVHH